jgi:plastocyanin
MGQRNEQSFSPNPLPVVQGSTVTWQNNDSTVHRIVMNDGSFDSGNISPGATSTAMRLTSANGQYHCALHPTTMFGSINAATDTPPPTTPPGTY